ncbi:MAG: DUF1501 domain-containing protein [Planctomyces sp.]
MNTNRRNWLQTSGAGLGALALQSLLQSEEAASARLIGDGASPRVPQAVPKAKRIISLFMHGGPSQMDLLDEKSQLRMRHGEELPASIRGNQRLTGMTSGQSSFPVASSAFRFAQHGQSGTSISELLPHVSGIADELCVVRSMHTEAINHDPALTLMQTGHQLPGRPSFGAWASYGLGSENSDLPAFVVLHSRGSAARPADPLYARLWGSGFLPSSHQGIAFRSGNDPVLFLSNSPGVDSASRRDQLDVLEELNRSEFRRIGDPEIETRIHQYEMAWKMQTSVPELMDVGDETSATYNDYGSDVNRPGSFARNCLLARRLAERGVRFIQLYHRGWDQHYNLPSDLRLQCRDVDQPAAALVRDLKQRGLLDDTIIIWGGEFGRTIYGQGKLERGNYGRDHHGRCFSIWLAGGGIRPGTVYGATDDYSYNVVSDPVHVHDLNATLMHLLGIDHRRLTFRHQGRDYRLTDVHGSLVSGILS